MAPGGRGPRRARAHTRMSMVASGDATALTSRPTAARCESFRWLKHSTSRRKEWPEPTRALRNAVTSPSTNVMSTPASRPRRRAPWIALGTTSTPVTCQPRRASSTDHLPVPQPRSSADPNGGRRALDRRRAGRRARARRGPRWRRRWRSRAEPRRTPSQPPRRRSPSDMPVRGGTVLAPLRRASTSHARTATPGGGRATPVQDRRPPAAPVPRPCTPAPARRAHRGRRRSTSARLPMELHHLGTVHQALPSERDEVRLLVAPAAEHRRPLGRPAQLERALTGVDHAAEHDALDQR